MIALCDRGRAPAGFCSARRIRGSDRPPSASPPMLRNFLRDPALQPVVFPPMIDNTFGFPFGAAVTDITACRANHHSRRPRFPPEKYTTTHEPPVQTHPVSPSPLGFMKGASQPAIMERRGCRRSAYGCARARWQLGIDGHVGLHVQLRLSIRSADFNQRLNYRSKMYTYN